MVAAAFSPLLAWREPVYIVAGFAGIVAMALVLFQPLLAAGYLPGLRARRGRDLHRWVGGGLVVSIVVHVAGLWITSPPDVMDALLFVSPTPFSAWGVIAMWCVFASATLALCRRRLRLRPVFWRRTHKCLAAFIVSGSAVHAWLIEGTMETVSKGLLCVMVVVAAFVVLLYPALRTRG
jgi:hypothetical protein